jgi:phosphoribosylanthranilate isomerase
MTFDVIPAIDVSHGRLARLREGQVAPVDAFGGDPLAAAEEFVLGGAKWLHVVDLELAFSGEPGNLETVSLLAVMDARVQASGGIATQEHVRKMLGAGAQRVVLGSAALADRPLTEKLVAHYGDSLAVALEVAGGAIRPRGREDLELPFAETLDWLRELGVPRFVHVAVDRVGGLSGPDLDGLASTAFRTQRPVIASGGVASAADVRSIRSLGPLVQGVVLGRSLYEGGLTVRQAIRAAAESGA